MKANASNVAAIIRAIESGSLSKRQFIEQVEAGVISIEEYETIIEAGIVTPSEVIDALKTR